MTKQLKKGLLAILMFVMSVAMVFSLGGFTSAFAEELTRDQQFAKNVQAFVDLADADDSDTLTATEIRSVMGDEDADALFIDMYNYINNEASDATDATAKQTYTGIFSAYDSKGAVKLYSELVTTAHNVYNMAGYSYKDHVIVEALRTKFNEINTANAEDLAFLKNVLINWVDDAGVSTPKDLVEAEKQIKKWKEAIDETIKAIKEIQVYVVKTPVVDATTNVFDDVTGAYLADYEVLLSSKSSKENARRLANIVINDNKDEMYISTSSEDGINHLEILKAVERAYTNGVEAEINRVKGLIDAAYTKYQTGKCYTIRTEIKAAETAFNALPSTDYNGNSVNDTLNNLKAELVTSGHQTKLTTMTGMLGQVDTAINGTGGVKDKIAAIGDVKYTSAIDGKIRAARAAFDALDDTLVAGDVIAWDNEEGREDNFCVEGYDALLEAEDAWDNFVDEIDALIEDINDLRDTEINDSANFFKAFSLVQSAVGSLSDKNNQLNGEYEDDGTEILKGINKTLLDNKFKPDGYVKEIVDCEGAYSYFLNLANAITTATGPIKVKINELNGLYGGSVDPFKLGDVRLTNAFDAKYEEINTLIDNLPKKDGELDPRYKGAIDNLSVFESLSNNYKALLTLADAWVVTVKAVGTVCIDKLDELVLAETAYKALKDAYPVAYSLDTDIDAYTRKYAEENKTYADYYQDYTDALELRSDIFSAMDMLVLRISNLENERPLLGYDRSYEDAVVAITDAYNALEVDFDCDEHAGETKEYFRTNDAYKAYYESYVKYLVYVEASKVESEIMNIVGKGGENANHIATARDAYDAITALEGVYTVEDVQKEVRNYNKLTEVEAKLTAWVNKVNALLTGAGFNGEDITAVEDVVVTSANVTEGFYKLNIEFAKAYVTEYNGFTAVEKAYVDTFKVDGKDVTYNVAEAYALVVRMLDVAGLKSDDSLGSKLTYINTVLGGFVHAYNNDVAYEIEYSVIAGWVNALTDSQRNKIADNITLFKKIESDKLMADNLAVAIDKIYASAEITSDTIVQYYTVKAFYESLLPSQKGLVVIKSVVDNTKTAEQNVRTAFATIEGKLAKVQYNFADIIDRIEELEKLYSNDAIDGKIEVVEGLITDITKAGGLLDVAKQAAITAANEYADGLKLAVEGKITDLEKLLYSEEQGKEGDIVKILADIVAINAELGDLADAIDALDTKTSGALATAKTELEGKINTLKTELEGKINTLKTELEGKINAEKAEREEADAAIKADLEAAVAKLNKTIVTITVIFGVVSLALAGCVVFIFLKKKA